MPTATLTYQGDLRTQAVHLKSNNQIITDAPTINHGRGEAFSPTDLLATSLASCMLTIIGIKADDKIKALAKYSFQGQTASLGLLNGNPQTIAVPFMNDGANDLFNYVNDREDMAMLFEETMMKFRFD